VGGCGGIRDWQIPAAARERREEREVVRAAGGPPTAAERERWRTHREGPL
jgi:hypothetical protein